MCAQIAKSVKQSAKNRGTKATPILVCGQPIVLRVRTTSTEPFEVLKFSFSTR